MKCEHGLVKVAMGDRRAALGHAALNKVSVRAAPVVLGITCYSNSPP
ncbi:MAG: hypothetical protein MUO67_25100 [Anaerolineales bacterium]|nr:hypothetical protein [Anaerolineales bacterium]